MSIYCKKSDRKDFEFKKRAIEERLNVTRGDSWCDVITKMFVYLYDLEKKLELGSDEGAGILQRLADLEAQIGAAIEGHIARKDARE